MDLLYIVLVFFVIALLLAIFGPMLGVGGSEMAYKIAVIFLIIFIVLEVLSLVLGGDFGFGHSSFQI